jgi:hypothetical protein
VTRNEVIDLLTLIASFDRRTAGKTDVAAWQATVGDLAWPDAQAAVVEHYRESTEWLMPAHIRQRVAAMRQARLDAAGPTEIPEHLADRPLDARAWLQEARDAIADGREPPKAIEGAR